MKQSRDCYYRISQNIFQSQIDFICAIENILKFKQEFIINNTKYLYGVVITTPVSLFNLEPIIPVIDRPVNLPGSNQPK